MQSLHRSFSFLLLMSLGFMASNAQAQESKIRSILINAQETQTEVVVVLNNGDNYVGLVTDIDTDLVSIENEDGVFSLRISRIREVRLVDSKDRTSRWYPNPSDSRLFLTQSGKMIPKGEALYQNTYIFVSNFSYGISKNFSANAGFSMIPGIGIDNQLFLVGAKLGISLNESLLLSANTNFYGVDGGSLGTIFSSLTYSKNALDVTGGLGIGFAEGGTSEPIFIFGAQYRTGKRFALLTENLVIPTGVGEIEPLVSFGGRFIGPRITADLGFFSDKSLETLVPIVSFAVKL